MKNKKTNKEILCNMMYILKKIESLDLVTSIDDLSEVEDLDIRIAALKLYILKFIKLSKTLTSSVLTNLSISDRYALRIEQSLDKPYAVLSKEEVIRYADTLVDLNNALETAYLQ